MKDIYEELVQLIKKGEQTVLVTVTAVTGSVPRHTGSKMIVRADGSIFGTIGGGALEKDVIAASQQYQGTNQPTVKSIALEEDEGMLCGGSVEILFEPIGSAEKLFVFGAGHIGLELAPLALKAGFHVTVADDRPEFASPERFPEVNSLEAGAFKEILPRLQFNERTYIVIVTHGHKFDEEVLYYCVQQPFAYLGMIGSQRKTLTIFRHLEEKGIDAEKLNRVNSPVGLNIGAETPFEIAISIMSEMIAVRKKVDIDKMAMRIK